MIFFIDIPSIKTVRDIQFATDGERDYKRKIGIQEWIPTRSYHLRRHMRQLEVFFVPNGAKPARSTQPLDVTGVGQFIKCWATSEMMHFFSYIKHTSSNFSIVQKCLPIGNNQFRSNKNY